MTMQLLIEMQFSEMVSKLAKPGQEIIRSLDAGAAHILHMAVGLIGEVVELMLAVSEEDAGGIIEELGDIEFYLEGLSRGCCVVINREFVPSAVREGEIGQ